MRRPAPRSRAVLLAIGRAAVLSWLGAGGLGAAAPAPAPEPVPAPLDAPLGVDPQVRTGTLANGLRYVIRANSRPERRAELRLVVDVGSVVEAESERGLAHFTEHMAFNGSRHFARHELVSYLESAGMRFGPDLNAFTDFDRTVYMLTVPTDSAAVVDRAFQILQDWAHGLALEGEAIDRERQVVIEEWRLGQGAERRMFDRQVPVLLAGSRYAERLPIGQKEVLETFPHDALRAFYRRWYRPDLMGFVAVGDFEVARVESLATACFDRIPLPDTPPARPAYPVPDHEETLFAIVTDPEATQNRVSVYYKQDVRDFATARAYRLRLMESLYHGMFNRRLFELTTRAQPPFLAAASDQGRWLRTKEFFFLGATVENNGFGRGLEALLTEAARVRQHGFAATELARQKQELLRGVEQAFRERHKTHSSGYAAEYVRHLLEGEPIPGIEAERDLYRQLLPGIGLAEVNGLAREWTGESNRVIAVNAPERPGIAVPTEEELRALFAAVEGRPVDPYADQGTDRPLLPSPPTPGAVAGRGAIPELGVTVWTLSNGARVFLKPTDFKNDEILFSAYSPGGHSRVDDAQYLAAVTATAVVTQGGVGNFDQVGLAKWLSGKVVGVSPYISELDEGLSGSASPEDAETLFQLICGYFTAPRADSVAFDAFRTRLRASVENRSARPETAYFDTIAVTMAQHHFRARPWALPMLDELDLERSLRIYRDRFADAGDFTFFFVGSFTLDGLEPLVATYLAGLPAAGRQETWRDVGVEPPAGIVEKVVRRGLEPKSQTRLIFTGPCDFDDRRARIHLDLMAEAFQIKLREVLRQDLAGTYGVSVSAACARDPREEYRVTLGFGCDPARVDELTAVLHGQIDSLRTFGPAQVYLDKVRQMRRRQREVDLKENGWWLGALRFVAYHGLDPLLILDESVVDGLTRDDLRAAAQSAFDTGRRARFVLLPADSAGATGALGSP